MARNTHPTSALEVAYYFLKLAKSDPKFSKTVTNKKLQKLLYYSQVWHLAIFDKKLFPDRIEAWVHGPAIPKVYRTFRAFEFNPITLDVSDREFDLTASQKKFLQNIWDVYGKLDAEYLETLTHSELPWQEARAGLETSESSSKEINLDTAKKYYAAKRRSSKS